MFFSFKILLLLVFRRVSSLAEHTLALKFTILEGLETVSTSPKHRLNEFKNHQKIYIFKLTKYTGVFAMILFQWAFG